ncbi:MAG: hypothetical protein Q9221_008780 [Calogaya cf. arnoldii]
MDAVHEDDVPMMQKEWHNLTAEQSTRSFEIRLKKKKLLNGELKPVTILASAVPEMDENGLLKSISGTTMDISEIKQAQENAIELSRLQRQSRIEAEEAKAAQERHIDITSHEMRNPLSAILQSADSIWTTLTDYQNSPSESISDLLDSTLESASIITLCAQQQNRILNDVLTLSKLDAGILPVTASLAQPLVVARNTLKMFEGELQSSNIEWNFVADETYKQTAIDWVMCDPSRLSQVSLAQHLVDAVSCTPTHHVLRFAPEASDAHFTALLVSKINRNVGYKAAGTFAFYVKGRRADAPDTEATPTPHPKSSALSNAPTSSLEIGRGLENTDAPLHILLVEDNLINQKVLRKQLTQHNCQVQVANHGLEAIEYLETTNRWYGNDTGKQLDVVLMDLEMPVMDGLTCARKIRQLQREGTIRQHVPLIAVTANARKEQIDSTIEAGMDDVMTKPFKVGSQLQRVIRYHRAVAYPSRCNKRTVAHDHVHEINKLGAAASESAVCSRIGVNLLKDGGNAADAMVGAVFCIGVVGMYHSGIGGGGFMLVRSSNGSYTFIDFRETAPAAAFQDMYNNDTDLSLFGGLASGVPGELRGLEYLHNHFGKLPWSHVLQPAINLARNGFNVTSDLINYMDSATKGKNNFLVNEPTWAIDFAPNGTRVGLGDRMARKRYADTLETISKRGADAFYSGPIANATIQALQRANGTMTLDDLQNYTVAIRKPASITYRNYKLTACSAPSSGEMALSVLKKLEGYPDLGSPTALNISTHRLDEAIRFGYGERANLGDPLFVPGLDEYQNQMLNETTAARVRSQISDLRTLNVSEYDPKGLESLETPGTSHIVAADASGMAITLTTTINLLFGSQLMVESTGVIMNNEMNDFSIPNSSNAFGYVPSPSNFIRPGKRPLSSISPTIVEFLSNNTLYFVVGAAGGSRIITSTIQNLWHVLDQDLNTAAALAQPRLHDQLQPNQVSFEYAYNNETVTFMKSLGHNVTWVAPGQSTAQALRRLPNGTFEAAGEPRQKASGGFAV